MKTAFLVIVVLLVLVVGFGVFMMFQRAAASQQMSPVVGVTDGQLTSCPDSPNCVSSFAEDERHAIESIAGDGLDFNALAAHIAEANNAEISSLTENYLHATYKSGFFGFVDDLELYFDGDQIHVRSASREGYSDLGANRKRVENLREVLNR